MSYLTLFVDLPFVNKKLVKVTFWQLSKIILYRKNIPHTPSNVGVLLRIIFSHTPDEAMPGGLAKACVSGKNCSVSEKIWFLIEYQTE